MLEERQLRTADVIKRLRFPLFTFLLLVAVLPAARVHVKPVAASASGYGDSASACPVNLAGKFVTGWFEGQPSFQWYRFFGEHTFTAADIMKLSFAIVPFESGDTLVALEGRWVEPR